MSSQLRLCKLFSVACMYGTPNSQKCDKHGKKKAPLKYNSFTLDEVIACKL